MSDMQDIDNNGFLHIFLWMFEPSVKKDIRYAIYLPNFQNLTFRIMLFQRRNSDIRDIIQIKIQDLKTFHRRAASKLAILTHRVRILTHRVRVLTHRVRVLKNSTLWILDLGFSNRVNDIVTPFSFHLVLDIMLIFPIFLPPSLETKKTKQKGKSDYLI